ncbi:MAG: type II secretion system F family protein [Lachnospiraceae bacterium]|nr:type II secretion system F family protein [Lachnospiraceae bacterium]
MKCKIFKNLSQQDLQTDYSAYRFSFIEYVRYIMEGMTILAVVSYLFYEKVIVFVVLTPMLFWYLKIKKQLLCEKRKKELKLQFRDLCISISSSLSAGSSLTNAVISAYKEMTEMYGEDSHISRELSLMVKSLKMNIPVESLFERFAARADVEDIKMFSEILNIAQKGGGDMIKIMKTTAEQIGDKVDIERDIQSIINAKKYEQTIMNIVPFIIIFYMKITSPETMAIMYKTDYGVIIMTICLAVYGAAYMLGRKITRIEV